MESPFVSVIIPNYNHAKYLDERIASVLNQTYRHFEVIILDDRSIDESVEIISKYRNNPHVSHILVNTQNSGSTFIQWNKGLEIAKGSLIWISESDDSCAPTMLEELVREFVNDKQMVLSFVSSIIIDENGVRIGQTIPDELNYFHGDGKKFIKKYLCKYNIIYNASSVLFLKDRALNVSKDYQNFKVSGDWLFWIYLCENGNVSMLNSKLNFFRRHNTNVTKLFSDNGIRQIEDKIILDYLVKRRLISWYNIPKIILFTCWLN